MSAFRWCGSNCHVYRLKDDPSVLKTAAECCHDRFCLPCAQTRAAHLRANVVPLMERGQTRFITLTIRHTDQGLKHELDRLYEAFGKLKRHKLWKSTQRGGVAFLEVKRSRDGKSWHPHLHVLSQGKYIDQPQLANVWHAVTGDSHIVNIKFVQNDTQVSNYVTKYASKPFDPSLFESHETLCEAMVALKGVRMIIGYGTWRKVTLTAKPDQEAWENLGTFEEIALRAARMDVDARNIMEHLCGQRTEEVLSRARIDVRHMAQLHPAKPPADVQLTLMFTDVFASAPIAL